MSAAKITEAHRRRRAVVYVRQSTLGQVERNVESAARQYALRERAVELGWPRGVGGRSSMRTLGRSGASSDGRLGFKELVAEVGLGHVGLVLALETSRLARSSADWHQLLDLCALTGTLIADADGVYSPGDFNDRLLLGPEGHDVRGRAAPDPRAPGRRAAQQGRSAASCGWRCRSGSTATRTAGSCCARMSRSGTRSSASSCSGGGSGSARQVVIELVAEGQQLPRRTVGQRRVRWARASYGAVHDLLDQPGLCGRVRVRPQTPREAPRRATARVRVPDRRGAAGGVVCLPARAPSRLCLLARVPRRRASGCAPT